MRVESVPFGTRTATFHVRDNVQNDQHVLKEVRSAYRLFDVKNRSVLDIGGHIGAFSVMAYHGGAAFISAVEPDPRNLEYLTDNLRDNLPPDKYEILHGAAMGGVADRDTVNLWAKPCPSMNSMFVRGGELITVPALGWRTLHSRREYHAVKIDCEGAEYGMLLNEIMPESVQEVLVELHLGKLQWRRDAAPRVVQTFADWECIIAPKIGPRNWVTLGLWRR